MTNSHLRATEIAIFLDDQCKCLKPCIILFATQMKETYNVAGLIARLHSETSLITSRNPGNEIEERIIRWNALSPNVMSYEVEAITVMLDEVVKDSPDVARMSTAFDTVKFRFEHGESPVAVLLAWEMCTLAAASAKSMMALRSCSTVMFNVIRKLHVSLHEEPSRAA
jgi:hypothetical protein